MAPPTRPSHNDRIFQRNTFEAIAAAVHDTDLDPNDRLEVALSLADVLVLTNSSFEPVLFVRSATGTDIDPRILSEYSTTLRLRIESGNHNASRRLPVGGN